MEAGEFMLAGCDNRGSGELLIGQYGFMGNPNGELDGTTDDIRVNSFSQPIGT